MCPDLAMKAVNSVNIAELKNHLSHYLRRVEQGDTIEVRDRKRPIARIVPIDKAEPKIRMIPAKYPFASIRDKRFPPANWPLSSLELLIEDRRKR
jgi:prevent-host-death family protein